MGILAAVMKVVSPTAALPVAIVEVGEGAVRGVLKVEPKVAVIMGVEVMARAASGSAVPKVVEVEAMALRQGFVVGKKEAVMAEAMKPAVALVVVALVVVWQVMGGLVGSRAGVMAAAKRERAAESKEGTAVVSAAVE